MKLNSYTIDQMRLDKDLQGMVQHHLEDFNHYLQQKDQANAADSWEMAKMFDKITLSTKLIAWVNYDPFAEKILEENPDVSDILFWTGKSKIWLCDRENFCTKFD